MEFCVPSTFMFVDTNMNRVSVIGSSGSGKTTMARAIAARLGLPLLELDSIFHLPEWTPLPAEEFRAQVAEFTAGDRWVVDGNYTSLGIGDIVWSRADTIVWMDLPKRIVMRRVEVRSLSRAATGEELWNGNRERWPSLLKWNPEENILRWSWTRFDGTRQGYERKLAMPEWQHLEVHRMRSVAHSDAFLEHIGEGPSR